MDLSHPKHIYRGPSYW